MIKEVISIEMKPRTPACDVIIEWAEETAKYFGVPFVLNTSFYEQKPPLYVTGVPNGGIKDIIRSVRSFLGETFPLLRQITNKIRTLRYANIRVPKPTQDVSVSLSIYYLNAPQEILACDNINCLPIHIDMWGDSIQFVTKSTKNLKLFYVTSRAIFDLIKAEDPNSRVHYMPLSVSDKYYSPNFENYRNKIIDVIQFGRQDP